MPILPDSSAHGLPELTNEILLQGYVHRNNITYFVFDESVYRINRPHQVAVTGLFRYWNPSMTDPRWQLAPVPDQNGVWSLAVPNANFELIEESTPFKFRVDDGRWLEPPIEADNRESGNLIFAHGVKPKRLHAEIRTAHCLWVQTTVESVNQSLRPEDYRLTSAAGEAIAISEVLPNTSTELFLFTAEAIDIRRVYYLESIPLKKRTLCRRDGWFRELYSSKTLGAELSPDGTHTTFRLFAPRADRVKLYLYRNESDKPDDAYEVFDLAMDASRVWEVTNEGDLHGVYYDYTVHGPADPGNFFYETHPVHISDPYARVSVDSFGKCRVWRRTTPATPLTQGRPAMENVIAYEVHVQDFTDLLPVDDATRGTIPAMMRRGLTNHRGQSIGFDYLIDLGINVVHLMPIQEFLHYPDDEWQTAFRNDPFMIENGIADENYDWGYRTTHAFAVESRFRKRGTEHGAQREQFRDLVQAFHDHGIAVIIDIVPNHTGENMDGRNYLFNFNAIDLPYYYRTNDRVEHIGPYGNEVKTEDRPMVQRWLIDQCRHWIDEFGIDGFRIDLAGQIDKQTLIKLRQSVDPDVIIYGEPWIPPTDPLVAKNPDWGWYKKDAPITFFQDDARNAFKGPTSNPKDKKTDRGFAGGNTSERSRVMLALANRFADELNPNMGINYLDIHDNWALADQFATYDWDGRLGVDQGPFRIAAGLLFTSLGPIVMHGGTEIMRSKGLAKLEEQVKHTSSGPLAFHGKCDTYNMRAPNRFVWENVGEPPSKFNGGNDYASMLAYWKGLIAFRNSDYGKVFRIGTVPRDDYYRWILPADESLLGYVVDDSVLVLINTSERDQTFDSISLPGGSWQLIADRDRIDHVQGIASTDSVIDGGTMRSLMVPKTSMKIWVRKR